MRSISRPVVFAMPLATILAVLTADHSAGQAGLDYRTGSLSNDRPQPVYSADPSDSWNRIFHALFTRTVRLRLSGGFAAAAPLERVEVMGFPDLQVSKTIFERIESGDRAIEPLDPFPVHVGSNGSSQRVLAEPHFSRLKQALADALSENSRRPPLYRALMQSDLWAAHDVLFAARPRDEVARGRKEELLGLLARSVGRLALSGREIASLSDNYADSHLPFELFDAAGDWIEVEYLPERLHDFAADFRRVTRVFLKPSSPPRDRAEWLDGLRGGGAHATGQFDAVALVVQLLLVDGAGTVLPTRLTYEVQVRAFPKGGGGRSSVTTLAVAELSRKAFLLDRRPGGLIRVEEHEPSYLPSAGNDYFFATEQSGRPACNEAVLVPLRKRCQSCHGEDVGTVFTFSVQDPAPPRVRPLNNADDEHARYVSRRKMERSDYKELRRRWER
jgi:hypothetical protein